MTTSAAFGWGSSHLDATPAGRVDLNPAGQLAVQQTLARYAFALDHGDLMALEQVLTEDAVMTLMMAGGEPISFVGRAAIIDLTQGATEGQTDQRRHNLTNIVIRRADAGTALVWTYLTLTTSAGGTPALVTTGFYTFELRLAEGEWRIANLFVGLDSAV
ncbi:nuclear transport factor 2 family protein [Micromonospora chokoriensis]